MEAVKMEIPLQEWMNNQKIKDEMIWKDAAINQFIFVRGKINGLMQNRLKKRERSEVQVISEHHSKSISLPVYSLQRGDLRIILRYNFFNWKMSVICDREIDANFDGLFHTTPPIEPDYTGNELSDVYFEGFPKDLIFDYYEETDKKVWSAEIFDDQMLWTTIYLILKALGYIEPVKWHTRKSHGKELDEQTAEWEDGKEEREARWEAERKEREAKKEN